jgi:hypothetical protein
MKEAFTNWEKAGRKMHLQINKGKTKYMPVTKKICTDGPTYLEIGPYKFETVYSFSEGGRMGSEWILGRLAWGVWIGFDCLRTGTGGGLL